MITYTLIDDELVIAQPGDTIELIVWSDDNDN